MTKQTTDGTTATVGNTNGTGESQTVRKTKTSSQEQSNASDGMEWERYFTKDDVHPYDEVNWVTSDVGITNDQGEVIFRQEDVEHPESWSQRAVRIVASKYFYGDPDDPEERESSMKELINRVAKTIRHWGENNEDIFASEEDAQIFEEELIWLLLHQHAAFNSPVWFNCGLWHEQGVTDGNVGGFRWCREKQEAVPLKDEEGPYRYPQCSACFILHVEDEMESILQHAVEEGRLFKYGSGVGTNFSSLRSSKEPVSGGGVASGPLSFMRIYDSVAGAIKSGGKTRRAAKMDILNIDHPDVEDFIWAKKRQEDIGRILTQEHDYDASMDGYVYADTLRFQNSNQSVRITDEFMDAYENDDPFWTKLVTTGEKCEKYEARDLMGQIAESAWNNAEPGVQFDDTINEWHTCKNSERINATNPCSEYVFIDDTACNLASLRLTQYLDEDRNFDVEKFRKAIQVIFTSQEILVDNSSYPTKEIAEQSHLFRTIGLGYADVGAMLMALGIPYDSKKGTDLVGAITAIMCGEAYRVSSELAEKQGTFAEFEKNREPMLNVMEKHRQEAHELRDEMTSDDYEETDKFAGQDWSYLSETAAEIWDECIEAGEENGYRNAQATVIAPTGTISFYMDCDTTGIEPDYSLVKYKSCSGGGFLKMVNQMVPQALRNLGYSETEIEDIFEYLAGTGTLDSQCPVNADTLKDKGFTEQELEELDEALSNARSLQQVFQTNRLDQQTLERLFSEEERDEIASGGLLQALGFSQEEIDASDKKICGHFTVEGAPHLQEEHYPVFECANQCGDGEQYIRPMGHVNMMASAQRWVSGAISKTVNLPESATVEDIEDIYYKSWKKGVKCIAVFRESSKGNAVYSGSDSDEEEESEESDDRPEVEAPSENSEMAESEMVQSYKEKIQSLKDTIEEREEELKEAKGNSQPVRRRLPDERTSITHKFTINGHEGYITVGLYEDGSPGELFITMAKEGSVVSGLMDSFATVTSIALQYGVPLEVLIKKFSHTRFEPSGWTNNSDIPMAKSIMDYIFRWLEMKFLDDGKDHASVRNNGDQNPVEEDSVPDPSSNFPSAGETEQQEEHGGMAEKQSEAPPCSNCGSIMMKNGTCYACMNCGETTGCS